MLSVYAKQAAITCIMVGTTYLSALAQNDCVEKGTQLFGQKKYKQAIMTLRKCDESTDAQKLLGLSYFEMNYMEDAKKYLQKAIKAYPDNISLQIKYADAFAQNRQFRKGVEEFRSLAKKYPKNIEIKRNLARVLGWNRDYDEAIAIYRDVLKKESDDYESWIQIGVYTSWDKKFKAAVAEFDKIIAAKPPRKHETQARYHKAEVLSWMKKFDESVAEYDKVIALDPKNAQGYLGKGQVLEWQGKYKPAIKVYEQALQAAPGNKDAKARLQNLMWVK